jgi:diamine N-acetyltransferase
MEATELPDVSLVEVDADNWRSVAALRVLPDQQRFVAEATYYLCLSHYGGEWEPLAVVADDRIVGHVMWGVDPADGSHWIGGMMIDAQAQGRGYGAATITRLLQGFAAAGASQAALSYEPDNRRAADLYRRLGFVETGEWEGSEVVARRPVTT